MKKLFFSLIILVSVLKSSAQIIKELNECAVEHYNRQDYKGAIYYFTIVTEINPKDSFAYFDRAMVKDVIRDYLGSIEDFTKAVQVDSMNVDNYFLRGIARFKLKDYQGAIKDFKKTVSL